MDSVELKGICVVYLVRFNNEAESFLNFIKSYQEFPAGEKHTLLIVFKGFANETTEINPYRSLLNNINYDEHHVTDEGFDITAYFKVANTYDYESFCFLNSYSQILDENWLRKLNLALMQPNAGLVGATGSYQSMATDHQPWVQLKRTMQSREKALNGKAPWKKLIIATILFFRIHLSVYCNPGKLKKYKRYFDKYPNYHIRTNAFMLKGELIKQLEYGNFSSKMDAYRFESGKFGLSKQVMALGFDLLVVGKDEKVFKKEAWHKSGTFWQGNQSNLLIADNQTRAYENGDDDLKLFYKSHAWYKSNKDNLS